MHILKYKVYFYINHIIINNQTVLYESYLCRGYSGIKSINLVVRPSLSNRISIFSTSPPKCIINSLQIPQDGIIFPSLYTETTFVISLSPYVSIVDKAFLSAHIPIESSVKHHGDSKRSLLLHIIFPILCSLFCPPLIK